MRRVWKKLSEKEPGNFIGELRFEINFRFILDADLHVLFVLLYIHMDT
jgi:hypothetical protein